MAAQEIDLSVPAASRLTVPTALRRALLADVVLTGGCGALLLAGSRMLDGPLGLPVGLLASAGPTLLVFVALVAVAATRQSVHRAVVGAIVGVNLLWGIGSVVLLLAGSVEPTRLGIAFVLAQAGVVLVLAGWQLVASRAGRANG